MSILDSSVLWVGPRNQKQPICGSWSVSGHPLCTVVRVRVGKCLRTKGSFDKRVFSLKTVIFTKNGDFLKTVTQDRCSGDSRYCSGVGTAMESILQWCRYCSGIGTAVVSVQQCHFWFRTKESFLVFGKRVISGFLGKGSFLVFWERVISGYSHRVISGYSHRGTAESIEAQWSHWCHHSGVIGGVIGVLFRLFWALLLKSSLFYGQK